MYSFVGPVSSSRIVDVLFLSVTVVSANCASARVVHNNCFRFLFGRCVCRGPLRRSPRRPAVSISRCVSFMLVYVDQLWWWHCGSNRASLIVVVSESTASTIAPGGFLKMVLIPNSLKNDAFLTWYFNHVLFCLFRKLRGVFPLVGFPKAELTSNSLKDDAILTWNLSHRRSRCHFRNLWRVVSSCRVSQSGFDAEFIGK